VRNRRVRAAQVKGIPTATAVIMNDLDRSRIHASFFSLTCGALGILAVGVGSVISPGKGSEFGWGRCGVGWILVAIAVIARVEHLSRRLGRAAVVCAIIAAVAMAVSDVPFSFDANRTADQGWINFVANCWAVAMILASASFALVSIRKDRQMEAFLRLGKPGIFAVEDYNSTIHASFLTLGTATLGWLALRRRGQVDA